MPFTSLRAGRPSTPQPSLPVGAAVLGGGRERAAEEVGLVDSQRWKESRGGSEPRPILPHSAFYQGRAARHVRVSSTHLAVRSMCV